MTPVEVYKPGHASHGMRRALLAVSLAALAGCAAIPAGPPFEDCEHVPGACHEADSHNAAGGFIAACGDLPGMLGDDC